MKITNQLLIIVVILAGLMPLYAGYLAYTTVDGLFDMFHLKHSSDIDPLVVIMGLFFISFATIYLFDAYLLIKKRHAGRQLAILLGFISIMSGVAMAVSYSKMHIDGGAIGYSDIAKGAVLVLLGMLSKDK